MPKKVQEKKKLFAANQFSFKAFSDFVNANFSLIILLVMAFILGFLGGSLWKENALLKTATVNKADTAVVDDSNTDTDAAAASKLENMPTFDPQTDHVRGNKNAKVVLVEYSDFECPYCNKFHPTMLALMEKYGDQIAWVYRHFPLSFHPNAQTLAEASECVNTYGSAEAFWSFADSVYEKVADSSIYSDATNKKIDEETILSLAAAAGADRNKVKSCLDSGEMTAKVKADQTGGGQAGVNGTPNTIIVSEKGGFELIPGALSLEQVESVLANHL